MRGLPPTTDFSDCTLPIGDLSDGLCPMKYEGDQRFAEFLRARTGSDLRMRECPSGRSRPEKTLDRHLNRLYTTLNMAKWARFCRLHLCLLTAALFAGANAFAEDVVVVVSSELAPYQEALAGVQEALGKSFQVVDLSKTDNVPSARVVITIGGRATLRPYPSDTNVIYCVALGVVLKPGHRKGRRIKISLSPAPLAMLQTLKRLQPDLKRLGVLWNSDSYDGYIAQAKLDAEKVGLTLESRRLDSPEDLPEALRAVRSRVDALWVPPDPLLLTEQSFAGMSDFSVSNRIPLYVSIDNLADKGATAAIATGFRDMGHKAGDIARSVLSGDSSIGDNAYIDRIIITINESYASKTGLTLSPAIRKEADRLIQ